MRFDLSLVQGESVLFVGHRGIDRVADNLQGALQRGAQGISQDHPAVTAVQRGIVFGVGHPAPTAHHAERAAIEPHTHGRQVFQRAVPALPIGEGGHLHDVLAQEKMEQIDAVGPHRHHGPGAANPFGVHPPLTTTS